MIIGAGFTGLWAAVQALEDMPGREVVVLEGEHIAFGGSGRNGGFCDRVARTASERGGRGPGRDRADQRERPGELDGDRRTRSTTEEIDWFVGAERKLIAATRPHAVPWCAGAVEGLTGVRLQTAEFWTATRCALRSTRRRTSAGVWSETGAAQLDPARLAWGLRRRWPSGSAAACTSTRAAIAIEEDGDKVVVRTPLGRVRARRAIARHQRVPAAR